MNNKNEVALIVAKAMLEAEIEREPGAWDTPAEEWTEEALEIHGFLPNARAAIKALFGEF